METDWTMDFILNESEISALYGLLHIQQLAYLRGIRPYMDVKTGLVGIKRGISYQSIADNLYVEPHQGIKSVTFTRTQVRRALPGLVRVGLISIQSDKLKLILKCELATKDYFALNKVVTNASQKVDTNTTHQNLTNTEVLKDSFKKGGIDTLSKVVTPPYQDNNYIYLLSQNFEKFWSIYPEKKSKSQAFQAFQLLNPDEVLFSQMMDALNAQITHRQEKQLQGMWVPPWKYPVNWISKKCWEDEITFNSSEEKNHATNRTSAKHKPSSDMFWDESFHREDSTHETNVVPFRKRGELA